MSEQKHSPLPWEFDHWLGIVRDKGNDGAIVIARHPERCGGKRQAQVEADFRLICRAVNNLDALLAAAEELADRVDAARSCVESAECKTADKDEIMGYLDTDNLRAAVKQARGEG